MALAGRQWTKPRLWPSLSVTLGPVFFRWAAGSGICISQDTDGPATLGSQPGLLLSFIPIFGGHSCLIHIPMSILHNLPQILTALELGKGKGQLMSRGREAKGERRRRQAEAGRCQELPVGSTPSDTTIPTHTHTGPVGSVSLF